LIMHKHMLFIFLSFILLSSEGFSMEKGQESLATSASVQQKNVQGSRELDINQMHSAFAHYSKTGDWGYCKFEDDHTSDLMSGKKRRATGVPPFHSSRGTSFYFVETSDRIPQEGDQQGKAQSLQERVEQVFDKDKTDHSLIQDHLGDLMSKNNKGEPVLKRTRGSTFYIPSTSSANEQETRP